LQLLSYAPFVARISASTTSLHKSVTLTLPARYSYVRLIPHIPIALTTRPYRLFYKLNGTRLGQMHHSGAVPDKPLFEAWMSPGSVNKIEFEVLAGKGVVNGVEADFQWEKITCLIHVLKN
jgi:hypothetical protein